jgi:hypothetical protein
VVIPHHFFAGLEDSTNRITHFEKWKRRKLLEDLQTKYRTNFLNGYVFLIRAFTRFLGLKSLKFDIFINFLTPELLFRTNFGADPSDLDNFGRKLHSVLFSRLN